jgi:PAS domain S-box-containing protein
MSPETFTAAFDALPAAAVVIDDSGKVCASNEAMRLLFGFGESQLHLRLLETLLPGPHDRREHLIDERAHPGMSTLRIGTVQQFRAVDADGRTFPVDVTSSRISLPSGNATVVLVTDRSSVRELESMFDGTFESSPQGLAIVDERNAIVRINRQLARMIGYESTAVRGRQLSRLVPGLFETDAATGRQLLRIDVPTARDTARVLTVLHADGREVTVDVRVTVLSPTRSLVAVSPLDQTPERARPLARLDTTGEVEFTHVASHDLKSPLRGVSDLVEWITEELGDGTPASVAHNLGRIRARLLRMELLIDQLLAYARVGRSPGSQRLIDVHELVSDALALVSVPDEFTVHIDVDVAPFVGSSTPLETVVRNLISNAVTHHDRGDGTITVRARVAGQFCRVEVSDDGPGVAPIDHARIFRLFQTATGRLSENTGLGLAVCRRLCEAHGATIEIDPTPGRGATFVVEWPLVATGDVQAG